MILGADKSVPGTELRICLKSVPGTELRIFSTGSAEVEGGEPGG